MSAKKNTNTSSDAGMSRKERRAAERAARRSGSPSTSSGGSRVPVPFIAGGAIVVAVLLVLVLVVAGGGLGDEGSTVTAADVPPPADALQVGRSLGDPGAPVKIEVYEDPQCPACGQFNERIEPLLLAGPIKDGEVFMTYRDFAFLGPESFSTAAAMRVVEDLDGKFWEFHDVVFHNQDGENRGRFNTTNLADMAELVGVDRQEFLDALDDPDYERAVQEETAEGRARGVNSTPTLVINGAISPGVPDWDSLRARIADEVAAAS